MPRWPKGKWFAWRSRHDLTDRLPGPFQDVLDAVTAFADPILTNTLTVVEWDPATRSWNSVAGAS
jgi:alkylhydroperoxidase/carboxymuconolactone decarboxylase family protein YurZ